MSDAGAVTAAKPRKKRGVLLPLVLFLLAAIAFGAVFVMYDGATVATDLYEQLLAVMNGPTGGPLTPPGGGDATSTVSIDPNLAKRMYVEQIESAVNLERMAKGQIVAFDITEVDQKADSAVVGVRARFIDDTSAEGALSMVKAGGNWYLFSITGLRDQSTGGLADSVAASAAMEDSETLDAELAEAGVKTIDEGVLKVIVEQQAANQVVLRGILDGMYTKLALGPPVEGAGTITIPVTLMGSSADTASGQVVMIRTTVDAKARLFLTTLSIK